MKALILGGTGKISAPVARILLSRKWEVVLFNRGRTISRDPVPVRVITGDRDSSAAFETLMRNEGPWDCVIDMICCRPQQAEADVRAFRGRTRQLIMCSTIDVYAKPARVYPITEGWCREPTYPYGLDKARSEDVLMRADERGDFAVTILRPGATYDETGRAINSLGTWERHFARIRSGRPIVVHGDGSSLWASTHAGDVAQAFAGAAGNRRAFGRAYNVTGDEWITWDSYHRVIAESLGVSDLRIVHIPSDVLAVIAPQHSRRTLEHYRYNAVFDVRAAREDLGFACTVSWAEGVRRMVEWWERCGAAAAQPLPGDEIDDHVIAAWDRMVARLSGEMPASA